MRRKDEKPPEDHWRHREPELETNLLDEYYKFKGWNNQGVPTKESLQELGLDFVVEDFEPRGVYEEAEKPAPAAKKEPVKRKKPAARTKTDSPKRKKAKT
jgi:hypothetical protein